MKSCIVPLGSEVFASGPCVFALPRAKAIQEPELAINVHEYEMIIGLRSGRTVKANLPSVSFYGTSGVESLFTVGCRCLSTHQTGPKRPNGSQTEPNSTKTQI